jgi:GATA-binding protein
MSSTTTGTPRIMTTGPTGQRSGLRESRLDLPLTHGAAHPDMLRSAAFQPFQQNMMREGQSLDEMQRQDPLATQIWKFYARTKQLLPAQERMENLTWRMMHLKLQRTRAANAIKYVFRLAAVSKTTVLQAHQRMPPAGLRNCASRPSMPRCRRIQ